MEDKTIMDYAEKLKAMSKQEQMKKVRCYTELNKYVKKGGILFTGSSLMEQFPINEFCMDEGICEVIYNRGIGGFQTDDFLENIDVQLLDLAPKKLFINIGTNDFSPEMGEEWEAHLFSNLKKIYEIIKEKLPETCVYVMAFYPVNDHVEDQPFYMSAIFKVRSNENIKRVNEKNAKLAEQFRFHYIDVNDQIKDDTGSLKAEYTVEGMHMYPEGYKQIFESLKKYILS